MNLKNFVYTAIDQKKKEKEQSIPLKRIGQPEEIAKVALFLASDNQATLQEQQSMLTVD